MNKSLLTGTVLGAFVAAGGAAITSHKLLDHGEYADVVSVTKLTQEIKTPREECRDEVVTQQPSITNESGVVGSVGGAIAGDVIGNETGAPLQPDIEQHSAYQTTENVCSTVYDVREHTVGYNVEYRIGDRAGHLRLDHDPGPRIPLHNGQLILRSTRSFAA